ncbi:LysR family transcriptional regulator [Micromonospora sp. NPDC126480]|uniref:LysR family transcriptional regulator n=1 Tax=Micromonospora sp. NPDC126480 TaxID=3155312 RepID=UPI00331BE612
MLERQELDAFIAVAEELHFGRAAQRLLVSTTRVSQTIRRLERRVGVPLFNRTSRRVELTRVGRELYDDVKPAWVQIAAALQRAVAAGRGTAGTLRVGFVGAAGGQLVLEIAELFRARHPDCDVRIREVQLGEVGAWLRDGVVDVVLAAYPIGVPDVVAGGALISEARMLAVPAQHPLAARDSIPVEDLATLPLLAPPPAAAERSDARTPTTESAAPPVNEPATATFQELLTLVGSGRGMLPVGAHVRRYYARPDVTYVVVAGATPVQWGLVWGRGAASARVLAFNEAALDLVRHG